jgi:DNA-directed RNA polymerase specialized sigma24 family protein
MTRRRRQKRSARSTSASSSRPAGPTWRRRSVYLRFFENRTQSEIAAEIGISQMHVSRILSQTLATLRDAVT